MSTVLRFSVIEPPGAVGDGHERGLQPRELGERAAEVALALVGARREELEGERGLVARRRSVRRSASRTILRAAGECPAGPVRRSRHALPTPPLPRHAPPPRRRGDPRPPRRHPGLPARRSCGDLLRLADRRTAECGLHRRLVLGRGRADLLERQAGHVGPGARRHPRRGRRRHHAARRDAAPPRDVQLAARARLDRGLRADRAGRGRAARAPARRARRRPAQRAPHPGRACGPGSRCSRAAWAPRARCSSSRRAPPRTSGRGR